MKRGDTNATRGSPYDSSQQGWLTGMATCAINKVCFSEIAYIYCAPKTYLDGWRKTYENEGKFRMITCAMNSSGLCSCHSTDDHI